MRYLLFSFLLLSTAAHAQVKFEAGIEGSLDGGRYYPILNFIDNRPSVFINPAIVAGININNRLGIHAGIGHTSKADRFTFQLTDSAGNVISNNNLHYRYRYMNVPFHVSLNFLKKDKKLRAGMVALFDYSLFYAVKYDLPYTSGSFYSGSYKVEQYPAEHTKLFNRSNASVGGGIFAGYNFSKHFTGSANLHYKTDLIELYKSSTSNASYSSVGCTVSAMYRF